MEEEGEPIDVTMMEAEPVNNKDNPNNHKQDRQDDEQDDTVVDEVGDFVDMTEVVEVPVDDDLPMDDDDQETNGDVGVKGSEENDTAQDRDDTGNSQIVHDLSKFKIESHTDSVYAVASHLEQGQLFLLSGGGDDKAFLHKVAGGMSAATPISQPLVHPHKDTVSCVAFNLPFVSDDLKKTPRRSWGIRFPLLPRPHRCCRRW